MYLVSILSTDALTGCLAADLSLKAKQKETEFQKAALLFFLAYLFSSFILSIKTSADSYSLPSLLAISASVSTSCPENAFARTDCLSFSSSSLVV